MWGGDSYFRRVYFRGYWRFPEWHILLDSRIGGWNHFVIADVARLSPFRPVVGGGFCVLGVLVSREGGSGGDPSATMNLSPQDDNGDDEPVASG